MLILHDVCRRRVAAVLGFFLLGRNICRAQSRASAIHTRHGSASDSQSSGINSLTRFEMACFPCLWRCNASDAVQCFEPTDLYPPLRGHQVFKLVLLLLVTFRRFHDLCESYKTECKTRHVQETVDVWSRLLCEMTKSDVHRTPRV